MTAAAWATTAAVVVALAGLWFTIYKFRHGRSKLLVWSVSQNTALIPRTGEIDRTGMTFSWQGTSACDPRVIVVRLTNRGRIELKKSDLATRLVLDVSPAKLLTAAVTFHADGSTKDRRVAPRKVTDSAIELDPLILNPRDSLTFEALIDGDPGDVDLALSAAGFQVRRADRGRPARHTGPDVVDGRSALRAARN
ncbi:hypothetical protein [Paractinoplanes hotanensis]|uniref:Uncharacterized protein n=1 Tax=Paractinoplanes hotanensis TaxID=2906497 RepID=A0ABT0YGV8_9ACTN|nr:hypothetical protein [Actinoplanes hotanensis]MCM4084738.1 hypothetical protein [Actinoplanes hotanensis]